MNRLLIVTELFFPSLGGQEIRYLELGKLMIEYGWSVDVVAIGKGRCADEETVAGIRVHRLIQAEGYQRTHSRLRRDPLTIVRFALKVREYLKTHRFDVVLFNIWPVLPQLIAAPRPQTVTVIDWCEHRSGMFWTLTNRLLSRSATKHICVSDNLKSILSTRYKISDITSIPSGIFADQYRVSEHKLGVLFFGRLSPHKRPEEAIQAVISARNQGFQGHLTVAGTGPLLEELQTKYRGMDFVRIIGRVSDTDKLKLFAEHRLHILPSIREGFPRGVAEAMASGTPTITTNHPDNGTADIVRAYSCGVVIDPGPESIAAEILRLTKNDTEWETLHKNGLLASRDLDWHSVCQKFIQYTKKGIVQ